MLFTPSRNVSASIQSYARRCKSQLLLLFFYNSTSIIMHSDLRSISSSGLCINLFIYVDTLLRILGWFKVAINCAEYTPTYWAINCQWQWIKKTVKRTKTRASEFDLEVSDWPQMLHGVLTTLPLWLTWSRLLAEQNSISLQQIQFTVWLYSVFLLSLIIEASLL